MERQKKMVIWGGFALLLSSVIMTAGCSGTYYKAMEGLGIEKREILVDRVEEARDAQDEASEQFADALEQFRSVVNFDGGDLEAVYDRLDDEYENSRSDAESVSARINAVESVAEDLFEEWQQELDEYSRADLRRNSETMLRETRQRYDQMMKAMRRAEKSMDPVLQSFHDQVLFLKHNLNARAIGSLRNELGNIERETATLISQMQQAIAEADSFIQSMGQ